MVTGSILQALCHLPRGDKNGLWSKEVYEQMK
jgi:hypothetical protein